MVDIRKFWIHGILTQDRYYPDFVKNGGADLDGNHRIEGSEAFGDLDGNGIVGNHEDYRIYLLKNRSELSHNIPFFSWGEKLSVRNRIHQLLYLESDLQPEAMVEGAYHFLGILIDRVKGSLSEKQDGADQVLLAYEALKKLSVRFKEQDEVSFVKNIAFTEMDCDSSSFAVMSVGDELVWPLFAMTLPSHLFVRWEGRGVSFNMDYGIQRSINDYASDPRLDPAAVRDRVYLKPLDDVELEAQFLFNRGVELMSRGKFQESLDAFDRAVQLMPNFAKAYHYRGAVLIRLGRSQEALVSLETAIRWDRRLPEAHFNRGIALEHLSRVPEALEAYEQALLIDAQYEKARLRRDTLWKRLTP